MCESACGSHMRLLGSPAAGVTAHCELPSVSAGPELRPSAIEAHALRTPEPPLLPLEVYQVISLDKDGIFEEKTELREVKMPKVLKLKMVFSLLSGFGRNLI